MSAQVLRLAEQVATTAEERGGPKALPAPQAGPLLGYALLGRVRRVAELWPAEAAVSDPAAPGSDEAERVVRAVAAALQREDVGALLVLVDPAAGPIAAQVERVLDRLDAVRRALIAAVEEEHIDHRVTIALGRQAATIFARTARLVTSAALTLSRRSGVDGDSLGVTVHELRRPLTLMTSYAQLLRQHSLGPLDPRAAQAVEAIAQASETMQRLVDGLATVARLGDAAAPAPVTTRLQLADVVSTVVADHLSSAELSGVRLEFTAEPELFVQASAEELTLALGNLVGNAVKHAPRGSAVCVSADSARRRARLVVRDHGPGLPADDVDRLFEKYYRSRADRDSGIPGTGLGLHIVRTVAVRHGGTVSARPAPGGGAEFEIVLPRA